jgi:DNA primase
MAFADGFVEEVRRVADIVRLISEHVALKKAGNSWKGLCPFHNEKTPSFNVRSEPAVFHCFGCGEGGDVFKFVMLHERVGFPEAIESVARRFGVPVPEGRFEPGPGRKEREEVLALMEEAAQHFTRTLWSAGGTKAREYLLGRGFKKETLEKIRAGAARDAWDDLLGSLRGKFSPQSLLAAGLVLERQEKNGHYDRFRNRAVFPILNESGKVVAFGARSLDGSEPKYLNSPETVVYQKGRTLYGLSWARDGIRGAGDRVVLMEGYLDVARALEAGVTEAVATCGTALTPGHARLIHRFAERVVVNFDGDEAGIRAARKSLETLIAEGLEVRVLELPDGHDPDSFLKQSGAEAYRQRLDQAPLALEWLIRRSVVEHDVKTPPGKAAYLKALLPVLSLVESPVERAAWLPRIVAAGGLDPRASEEELRRSLATGSAPAAPAVAPRVARPRLLPAEKGLLRGLLKGTPGLDEALGELQEDEFLELASAEILRAARSVYLRGEAVTATALEAALTAEETKRLLRELALEEQPSEAQGPMECVLSLRQRSLERRLGEIRKQIALAAGEEIDALFREQHTLTQRIATLSRSTVTSH